MFLLVTSSAAHGNDVRDYSSYTKAVERAKWTLSTDRDPDALAFVIDARTGELVFRQKGKS